MIRLNMIRNKNNIITTGTKKIHEELVKQIDTGIKSSPIKEKHSISLEIADKPLARAFAKILELGEDIIKVKIKTVFVRSHLENGKNIERKFIFEDKFSGDQITLLKKGRNIVNKKGSFLNNLVENINKAISD